MSIPSDGEISLPRARLCELADVERGKHNRWLKRGLLPKKAEYGLLDIQQAGLLDELNDRLKPKIAQSVWLDIRDDIGIPGTRLELVLRLSTLRAALVRSDAELARAIPRGDEVIVIDLSGRAQAVDGRVREYLAATRKRGNEDSEDPVVSSVGELERESI